MIMYPDSGKVVQLVSAEVRTLGEVMEECKRRGLSGRVTYRDPVRSTYISAELIGGKVVACRGYEGGGPVEGPECLAALSRYMGRNEGVIEVRAAPLEHITLSMIMYPESLVEEVAAPAAPPKPAAPVTVPTPPAQGRVAAAPIAAPPKPAATTFFAGLAVADECIDPVQLYTVIRRAQLAKSAERADLKALEELLSGLLSTDVSHLYITASYGNRTIKLLVDVAARVVYGEVEGEGAACGTAVFRELAAGAVLERVRAWSVRTA